MGNNQSTAHNRLSKPKTNTNSPIAAAKIDSPASVNSRYADLSAKGRQQIKDALLSPVDSEFAPTPLPDREDVVVEPVVQSRGRPLSIASRSNSRTNSRSNSLSFFGNKHGSASKLGGFGDSKVSLVSTGQVDVEAAIRLLQEVKKNASPDELAALHEALEPVEEGTAEATEHGLSRNTSIVNRSSSSLTRRRSLLQTPGVATRNSPVEGRRRTWNSWKAPQLSSEEEQKWKATPKRVSPSSRLLVQGPAVSGSDSLVPRARTPCDLDYSHLGSLQLGTLMVTNGAPSPAPSAKLTKQQPVKYAEEDYFSSAELGGSPLMMKTTKRRNHVRSKSATAPSTTPLVENDIPLPTMKPRNLYIQTTIASQLPVTPPVMQLEQEIDRNLQSEDVLTQNAHRFAQSYQSEIPMSPFLSLTPSPGSHADIESTVGNVGFNHEEVAMGSQSAMYELDASGESTASALTAAIPCEHTGRQKPRGQRPLPRTSDSGYSSGGSFQSGPLEQRHSGLSTISGRTDESLGAEAVAPVAGPAELHAHSISYEKTQPAVIQVAQGQRRPPPLKMFEQSSQSAAKSMASPQTSHSVAPKASFDSTASSQKYIRRRRPSQPDAPVVQACQSIPEGTIPDIPDNVRIKFTRRLSSTPGMECLTNTYPSKDHVLSPAPTADERGRSGTSFQQLTELEPDAPPAPPVHGRKRSLSLFRRKSYAEDRSREKTEAMRSPGVVDLGTIAMSLGTSPYDVAMTGPARKTVTSPTHPHQLGINHHRSKSMVTMDSQAAAEFARMRSKDLALTESQLPQQRRKSHSNLRKEVGEARAAKRRPQSYAQDIPPVPLIDASKHKGSPTAISRPQNEGQRRPQSEMATKLQTDEGRQVVALGNQNSHESSQRVQNGLDWEAHSLSWSRRRKSIGEGLRAKTGMAEASASTVNSRTASRSPQDVESWGRFSGGLQYNYQGGGVIAGSAGTHSAHKLASSKSMQWKVQHGVDLSDVPIMLQRA